MGQANICLTYDFDAVSTWIHTSKKTSPKNLSRGLFGAEVGVDRLLNLHKKYDIPGTWFIPGHTIESFPEKAARIWDLGHDVQHHGWTHTPPTDYESYEDEKSDIEKGIEAVRDLTGRDPVGYRSCSWDFSENTLDILLDLDFEWDSSQMAHDYQPYHLHKNWSAKPDEPFDKGEKTRLIELPVSNQRDDMGPLLRTGNQGFVSEDAIYNKWRDQFDWMRENIENPVYVLTMHPQVSGMGHRVGYLEELIQYFSSKAEVRFTDLSTVAREFRDR